MKFSLLNPLYFYSVHSANTNTTLKLHIKKSNSSLKSSVSLILTKKHLTLRGCVCVCIYIYTTYLHTLFVQKYIGLLGPDPLTHQTHASAAI